MSDHILTITPCEDCAPGKCTGCEPPQLGISMTCSGVDETCRMFTTCRSCALPDDYDDLEQTSEAHGVMHAYVDGEWMRATDRCFVCNSDGMFDAAMDLRVGPGQYPVDFDVDDGTWLVLRLHEVAV